MTLGERQGDEKNDSKYCGVETEFNDDMPQLLSLNIHGGFDFVVAPLMDPAYRPSLLVSSNGGSGVLPFAGSDLVLSPSQWSSHVVGKISSWLDLDSEDEMLRRDSEITLKQEIAWASHLSLQACLLPAPKGVTCANYARCVNQILQNLSNMQLWLRIPLEKSDDDEDRSPNSMGEEHRDSWEMWNSFRTLGEHHSQLSVALDVLSSLPSVNSLARWFGEPVRAAIINSNSFLTNARGYPCLSKRHQNLLTEFFNHSIQIVISGQQMQNFPTGTSVSNSHSSNNQSEGVEGMQRHPLRSYLDYIAYLYQKMDPLPEQERFELGYRDYLQSPLQPLMDNLEAQTYETFEKDTTKYIQYQRAVAKALVDRVPDEKASTITTVLMVVGAGRGPLVRASLQAAEETGRKLKVYAVEKNPNAIVTLHSLLKIEGWEKLVTIVSSDMRCWDAPEKADILVSELLGSFGDNELSPECLDGAQRFLKEDGISIPSSFCVDQKGIIFNPIPADQSSGENNRSKMAGKSRPKPLNVYFYIPNIIGYLRILMNCVAFAVCFVDKKLFSLLYFISFVCDALDGWFARKFNQASTFGAVLDMVTDRVSTACLLVILSQVYRPGLVFLSLLALDISSHWLQMYSTFLVGKTSHKDVKDSSSWLFRLYYGNRMFMGYCCVSCEVLYITLFLLARKETESLIDVLVNTATASWIYLVLLALLLFGWAIKQYVNVIQMKTAADACVLYDMNKKK